MSSGSWRHTNLCFPPPLTAGKRLTFHGAPRERVAALFADYNNPHWLICSAAAGKVGED